MLGCVYAHIYGGCWSVFSWALFTTTCPQRTPFLGVGWGGESVLVVPGTQKIKLDWITSKPQGSACLCHIFHQTPPPSTLELEIQTICLDFLVLVAWLVGWCFILLWKQLTFVGLADLELTIESRLTSTCLNLSNARIIKTWLYVCYLVPHACAVSILLAEPSQ